jgi:hypothetical protein
MNIPLDTAILPVHLISAQKQNVPNKQLHEIIFLIKKYVENLNFGDLNKNQIRN